jgi:hypothetical protein
MQAVPMDGMCELAATSEKTYGTDSEVPEASDIKRICQCLTANNLKKRPVARAESGGGR